MNREINSKIKIGFWGGPEYSVITLNKLHEAGFAISFIVTSQDKPKGRNLVMTEPPVKIWGKAHGITVLQPEKIRDEEFIKSIKEYDCDVFVVMAYGKIMPDEILNMPRGKSINIHPSLLPKFRGSCPIESSIIADEKNTGVTLIRMDKDMDHGPIIAVKNVSFDIWPPVAEDLGTTLVNEGSDLLVTILPDWIEGKISEIEQDHANATYTKKIEKEDGLIDLNDDPYKNYLKIQAYHGWPSTFFFIEKDGKKMRVKITQASFKDGKLTIEKVIPEGKSETSFATLNVLT
jgi:methionyl-tRNA formyltransferase